MTGADGRRGHPSFLELDRHGLGAAPPDVAAHVAGCEACRATLARFEAPGDVPAWARRLAPRRRPWWSFVPRPARAAGLGVAAIACVALLWITRGAPGPAVDDGPAAGYVGAKGGPDLRLFVKRGDRVEAWNGSAPVAAGDLLRLEIWPDRFTHLCVFAPMRESPGYGRLYDAVVPAGQPTTLPSSWKVDGQPGDETLIVVLGPDAVSAEQLPRLLAADDAGRHWVRRLVLRKAARPDGSAP